MHTVYHCSASSIFAQLHISGGTFGAWIHSIAKSRVSHLEMARELR